MVILTECNLSYIVAELIYGKTAVFPTETTYGLGCDATSQEAVDGIYKIKERQSDKPLLVVVPTVEMAKKYLIWNDLLEKIATKYWPGPLTVVGKYRTPARPLPTLPLKGEENCFTPTFKEGSAPRPGVVSLAKEGIEGWSRVVGSRILGLIRTVPFRKELRKNKTNAEKILWAHLRLKRLGGLRFRRQHGIGRYIADFYHSESKTVIEVDGDVHFIEEEQIVHDQVRETWLRDNDYQVLRFNNVDVFGNLEGVLQHIFYNITRRMNGKTTSETPPCPPLERGEEALHPSFQGGVGPEAGGGLADGVVSKDNTVAIRVTAHPLLKSITEKLGRPIVATSANLSNTGDLYDVADITAQFLDKKEQPDILLNYGKLPKTKPTTIVSVINNQLTILRQGEITIEV